MSIKSDRHRAVTQAPKTTTPATPQPNAPDGKPLTPSFALNAYTSPAEAVRPLPADVVAQIQQSAALNGDGDIVDAATVANVEQPPTGVPTHNVECPCGQVLVHIEPATGAAVLHVYERNILRPHTLTDQDMPLHWRCIACGQVTTIGATSTATSND